MEHIHLTLGDITALAVAAREEYRSLDITFCLFNQENFDIWTAVYKQMCS